MTTLSIISALARNRTIGIHNTLPWHLPEDLQHFKALTLGHPILMGRKTYESLGRPLPGRTNIVITRSVDFAAPGCTVVHSMEAALSACADATEAFCIGGENLYRQALLLADRLYLTEVQADFEADAWFPDFDPAQWRETAREAHCSKEGLAYHFVRYERR